jgi:nicotinate phosphoribosyltransferase
MRKFHVALPEEIKKGETTDIYFLHAREVLEKNGFKNNKTTAEFSANDLPNGWNWAVFCGLEEVITLMEGSPIDLYSIPEGTVFTPFDRRGFRVPVMIIEGKYTDFALSETPLLGLICQASGIATKTARIKALARDKTVLSFGIRRMHPAICPMIDRSAFIGGCDEVSSLAGAKIIGREPKGTMPHSLIICFGDQRKAWKAFDETMPPSVSRIALVDTYWDEKAEAIDVAETLKQNLEGIRLDTPSSRKGNLAEIVREIRWELDLRGWNKVKILVSGGIREENIEELIRAGVDGFGIGTSISSARSVDYSMDLVEFDGKPCAKRGRISGKKLVYKCESCNEISVTPEPRPKEHCSCGGRLKPLLKQYLKNGRLVRELPSPEKIRGYALEQIQKMKSLK